MDVINKQQIADVLASELDRKEFLKYVGVAFLTLIGIGNILSTFANLHSSKTNSSKGYGSLKYGG